MGWCCQSLLLICKEEAGEIAIVRKDFQNFLLFNLQPMSFVSFIFPFVPLGAVASKAWGGSQILYCAAFGLEWAFFLVMLCLGAADTAFFAMAISAYFCFALTAAGVRASVRHLLGITGDLVSDACACCFYLPFAMGQMAGEDFTETQASGMKTEDISQKLEANKEPFQNTLVKSSEAKEVFPSEAKASGSKVENLEAQKEAEPTV